jgi:lysylphosphatidylglycerol synthetase-like protein (DUF2156 family)
MSAPSPTPLRPEPAPPPLPPPGSPADAVAVLQRWADNPSAFLALNAETRHFTVRGVDGLVAYRPAGRRHVVQLGGVVSAPEDRPRLLDAFLAATRDQGRRVVAVQLLRPDVEDYAARGFRVDQFGADFAVSLADVRLSGRRFVKLRNKLSRARRAGVVVREVGIDLPRTPELSAALEELERRWLRGKGAHARRLEFLVGERGGPADEFRRLFVAHDGDRLVGDLSLSPVFGRRPGWLHDLTHRLPDGPPGVAELLTWTALERVRVEGAPWLHLGLTPFTGLAEQHRVPGASSPVTRAAVRLLAEHGSRLYPAADQAAYKDKWAPSLVQPEYVAFSAVTPGAVAALLRLTRVV